MANSNYTIHVNRTKENGMKNGLKCTKTQFTRDEVIEHGEYFGCIEHEGGATEQRWVLDGIAFAEICNANGYCVIFQCLGKASKVLD